MVETALGLGMFDGVHIGHAELLRTVVSCKSRGLKTAVYTFSNHPLSSIIGCEPKLILTNEERFSLIRQFGVDEIFVDKFNETIRDMRPYDFAVMLKLRFGARVVVVGYNYTFGRGGQGTPETLREYGKELGFEIIVIQPVMLNETAVSSTLVRTYIENGDIEKANAMLKKRFSIAGKVVHNRHIGTTIGFPTANIVDIGLKPIPKFGVYATYATIEGRRYLGVTNVGDNPTVSNSMESGMLSVETHIFDYDDDAYGKILMVEFVAFIRAQVAFPSKEALRDQITCDKCIAAETLEKLI